MILRKLFWNLKLRHGVEIKTRLLLAHLLLLCRNRPTGRLTNRPTGQEWVMSAGLLYMIFPSISIYNFLPFRIFWFRRINFLFLFFFLFYVVLFFIRLKDTKIMTYIWSMKGTMNSLTDYIFFWNAWGDSCYWSCNHILDSAIDSCFLCQF